MNTCVLLGSSCVEHIMVHVKSVSQIGHDIPSSSTYITMEKINFNYSTRNIPLPSNTEYMRRFFKKTEYFLRRMGWKVYIALTSGMMCHAPHLVFIVLFSLYLWL